MKKLSCFAEKWVERAVKHKGLHVIEIPNGTDIINAFVSLEAAIAFQETMATDHDFDPDDIEVLNEGYPNPLNLDYLKNKQYANYKNAKYSNVKDGRYLIFFGVRKSIRFSDYLAVFLT